MENKMFSIKTCKSVAKTQLKGRMKVPVLTSLMVFALIALLECFMAPWDLTPNTGRVFCGSIITFLLSGAYTIAYMRLFIGMFKSTEMPTFKSFFGDFKYFWKCICANLWQGLWIYLWTLAFVFGAAIVFGILAAPAFIPAGGFENLSGGALAWIIIVGIIVYIGAVVGLMWKAMQYCLQLFVIAENPEISVIDALTLSRKMTKGYKWKLFLLELSFIGWFLLGIFTLGILYLWVMPYYEMTFVNAFMFIKKNFEEQNGAAPVASETPAVEENKSE